MTLSIQVALLLKGEILMKRNIIRIVSLILCVVFVASIAVLPASALTIKQQTKATECSIVTCGDKIFGKTSTMTVKNTSSYPIKVTFIKIQDCKVTRSTGAGFSSWSSITIYGGGSASFKIKTSLGNAGLVRVRVQSTMGMPYSYTLNGNNYSMIARTG